MPDNPPADSLKRGDEMPFVQIFLYLQVLDFLTTLVGFKFGAAEASPFIRYLMQWGVVAGLAASKLVAIALAGVCIAANKHYLIRLITYWYGALVVWNISVLLHARPILHHIG